MFTKTRRRLAIQFTAIIGAMLMILMALFYVLLTGVVSRTEASQLRGLADQTILEWRHHQLEEQQRPDERRGRPIPGFEPERHFELSFVQPQQFVVVTDSSNVVIARSFSSDPRITAVCDRVLEQSTSLSGVTEFSGDVGDGGSNDGHDDDDKRVYAAAVYSFPSTDSSGMRIYVGEDITERKELLRQVGWLLAGLSAALLALSSLAGYLLSRRSMIPIAAAFHRQQQFTADASHELRTPLSVLQSSVEIVQEEAASLPDFHRDVLLGMADEIGRMTRMTESLLQLARSDEQRLEPSIADFDAVALAASAVRTMTPYALKQGVALRMSSAEPGDHPGASPAEPLIGYGDQNQLGQVLVILLDNAIKYSPSGAAVTIVTRRTMEGTIVWAVTDTGIGIPPEELPHIFDRFYRVDKSRSREVGGTGLGLSVAAGIMEAHGGQIRAVSQPGEGSTFTAFLPKPKG